MGAIGKEDCKCDGPTYVLGSRYKHCSVCDKLVKDNFFIYEEATTLTKKDFEPVKYTVDTHGDVD